MKISIDLIAGILQKQQLEPAKLRAIMDALNNLAQSEAADPKEPAAKRQFVILVSDKDGKLPKDDFVGWILQIEEGESPVTTQDRIFRAAYDFNASKRGRLLPVLTVGEAIESVPAKFFREADLWIKTKTPVLVMRTTNALPAE